MKKNERQFSAVGWTVLLKAIFVVVVVSDRILWLCLEKATNSNMRKQVLVQMLNYVHDRIESMQCVYSYQSVWGYYFYIERNYRNGGRFGWNSVDQNANGHRVRRMRQRSTNGIVIKIRAYSSVQIYQSRPSHLMWQICKIWLATSFRRQKYRERQNRFFLWKRIDDEESWASWQNLECQNSD